MARGLARRPDDVAGWFQYYAALTGLGMHEEALEAILRAGQIEPTWWQVHHNRGLAYARLGQYEEAVRAFREAVRLDAGNPHTHYMLAVSLAYTGQATKAGTAYAVAVEMGWSPSDALAADLADTDGTVLLGRALLASGTPDAAVAELYALVSRSPTSARAHFELGGAYARVGRMRECVGALKDAIRHDPMHPEPHFELGHALAALGERLAALKEYEVLRELDPESAEVLFGLIYH